VEKQSGERWDGEAKLADWEKGAPVEVRLHSHWPSQVCGGGGGGGGGGARAKYMVMHVFHNSDR